MNKPQAVFGAVYYRRSNPPEGDWERDYAQAASDGMNLFRHWFLWSAIETRPGVYDWSKYDKQMELAAKYGIRTIIAEIKSLPEWLYYERPELLSQKADGSVTLSSMGNSTATGGFTGGLCCDNSDARQYTGNFLRALASRYKGHPALYGYDINNECHYSRSTCHCPATQESFRDWLRAKYGSLEALSDAWRRYGYTDWKQVMAPKVQAQFPDSMDWQEFCKERAFENMRWSIDIIRSVDPDAKITAHGVSGSVDSYASGSDDWIAASLVESYGFTFVACRRGNEKWRHWEAVDRTRGASRGKDFWHAEMQGGPLWLQPQVIGREKSDGRVATAGDVRLWSLVSLAGGARGLIWTRWRSLLDGPLFGAFGLYSNDGTPNCRSKAASEVGKWANDSSTSLLMASRPVKGDIGLVVHDAIQDFNNLMQQAGEGRFYMRCLRGAFRAFEARNIQADYVHFDDIDGYRALYFPYPIHLSESDAARLKDWVGKGGCLICEGLPGYFGEGGRVGTVQPNYGLDRLFGVSECDVEFMPDLKDRIFFDWKESGIKNIPGGLFRQKYTLMGATELARYSDGGIAAAEHKYGEGKTILIGTFPSEAFDSSAPQEVLSLFGEITRRAGVLQMARVSDENVTVRISQGDGRRYAWAINHGDEEAAVTVIIPSATGFGEILRGSGVTCSSNGVFGLFIPAKDGVVFVLE
ncbi:MAG: beta-galactosidase [Christensenellales bacterium]|jgi:beta-galactosidase